MTKVSIVSITYNQEKFIRQTLEGFVTQKTDFPFEVIIHDDASTDKTQSIIREYAEKFPQIIKPIYETKNQYSKGTYDFINDMFRSAKGDYIALCEGDDYWTDDSKLQKQVNFLENNLNYAICFHPVKVIFENSEQKSYVFPNPKENIAFTLENLLRTNFIQTNSVMYRRQNYNSLPNDIMPQDWYLNLYHAQFGKIGFIDETMSVYRKHPGGIWWDSISNQAKFWEKNGIAHLKLYMELVKLYGNKQTYRHIIYQSMANLFSSINAIEKKSNKALLQNVLADFPENTKDFIVDFIEQNRELQNITRQLVDQIEQLKNNEAHWEHETQINASLASTYLKELDTIRNSKSWRYTQKVSHIRTKVHKTKKTNG